MARRDYGGDEANFNKDVAAIKRLGQVEAEEAKLEGQSGRAALGNAGARSELIGVIEKQIDAVTRNLDALRGEATYLAANTKAWEANARARSAATTAAQRPLDRTAAVAPSTTAAEQTARRDASLAAARRTAEAPVTVIPGARPLRPRVQEELPQPVERRQLPAGEAAPQRQLTQGQYVQQPLFRDRGAGGRYESGFTSYRASEEAAAARAAATPIPNAQLPLYGPTRVSKLPNAAGAYDTVATGQWSAAEEHALKVEKNVQDSLAGGAAKQRLYNQTLGEGAALATASSQALNQHGALSTEFIQSFARGQVTLRDFGEQMTSTIGKFAGWAVAGGLVYGAYEALKNLGRGAIETQAGVSKLERSLPNLNKAEAEEGFRRVSAETNRPIKDVADAQFYAARAFPNQKESLAVARTAVLAETLDEVNAQEAVKSFGAANVAFGSDSKGIKKIFDELDVGQLKFNARLNQTLPQFGRAAPAFANAASLTPDAPREEKEHVAHQLASQLIELTRTTGGGGGTGGGNPATFLIREAANLAKGSSKETLREFGIDLARPETYGQKKGSKSSVASLNEYIQDIAPQLSNDELKALAVAAGGGSALGLRYALPLFKAGQTDLVKDVRRETTGKAAEGSAQKDLEHQLGRVDEQVKSVALVFERLGSSIGESGAISALQAFLAVLGEVGGLVTAGIDPFKKLGDILGSLPPALQEIALAAGAAGLGQKFLRTDKGLNARGKLGELPGAGYLDTASAHDLREAKAHNDAQIVQAERRYASSGARAEEAEIAARRASTKHATFVAAEAENLSPKKSLTPEGLAAKQQQQSLLAAESDAHARRKATRDLALEDQAELREKEAVRGGRKEGGLNDRTLSNRQRLLPYAEQGNVSPAIGARASTEPFIPATVGGAAEAERSAAAKIASQGGGAGEITSAAAQARAATTEATARDVSSVAAFKAAVASGLSRAGAEIRATAAEGGAAGAAASAALAGQSVAANAATGFRGAFAGFGSKLMKGVTTAFIGSAIAQLGGEVIGGKTGEDVASIGSDAALGAGVGRLFGPTGAVVGGVAGGVYGAIQSGKPTESAAQKEYKKRLRAAERPEGEGLGVKIAHKVNDFLGVNLIDEEEGGERGADGRYPGEPKKLTAAEKHKIEKEAQSSLLPAAVGGSRGKGRGKVREGAILTQSELEEEGKYYKETIEGAGEESSKDEQQKGSDLKKELSILAASSKEFGKNPSGTKATQALSEYVARFTEQTGLHPLSSAKYVEGAQQAQGAVITHLKETFTNSLTQASTPQDRLAAVRNAEAEAQREYETQYGRPVKGKEKVLAQQQQKLVYFGEQEQKATTPPQKAAIHKKAEEVQQEIDKTRNAIRAFKEAAGSIITGLNNFVAEAAKTGYSADVKAKGQRTSLKLAEAGNNPAAKERIEKEALAQTEASQHKYKRAFQGEEAKENAQHNKEERIAQNEKAAHTKLDELKSEGALHESEAPEGDPVARAQAHLQEVQRQNAEIQKSKAYTPAEKRESHASVNEAARGLGETVHSEAVSAAQLQGQIAQAGSVGDAVAQAKEAQAVAGTLAGLARNQTEALQAQLLAVEAGNQLQAAIRGRLKLEGEYADSLTTEPLNIDKKDIKTQVKINAKAQGPEEKQRGATELNLLKTKLRNDKLAEAEAEIDFEAHTQRINSTEEIAAYQKLLQTKGLNKAQKRAIQSKIYDLTTSTAQDFGVGNIRQPTVYDAKTLTRGATGPYASITGAAGLGPTPPLVIAQHAQQATGGIQLHQTNHIQVNVAGGEPGRVVAELERHYRVTTKSQLRSARLT